ncbi:MAG: hypothetical protein K0S11_1122 [Gammaproteobacteria bacterium]|nr:hypothetical protein [Gammaproteobacteria bacterium]
MRAKFISGLVSANGELLNKGLSLAENMVKFDKRTQQQLLEIFKYLQQSLNPTFSGEDNKSLSKLKSQFELLLNNPQIIEKLEYNSIENKQISAPGDSLTSDYTKPVQEKSMFLMPTFSLFFTPIEQQEVKVMSSKNLDEGQYNNEYIAEKNCYSLFQM